MAKTITKKAPAKKAAAKKDPVKKGFKMPTSVTLIMMIIAVLALLSWFIPGTSFDKVSGEFTEGTTAKLGLLSVINSVVNGFQGRADLIVFIFALGGFMALVMKTGMLEAMVGALIKKLNGREILLIPILMFIFAIGGSTFGLAEETLALAIVIIPVFLLAGFDVITALGVLLLGPSIGVRASTTNPFGLGTAISSIASSAESVGGPAGWIGMGDGIVLRLLAFAVFFATLCLPVMWYGNRVKKDPSKSFTSDINAKLLEKAKKDIDIEQLPEFTGKRKATMVLFVAAFVFLILSVIPWTDFGVNIFIGLAETLAHADWDASNWSWVARDGGNFFNEIGRFFVGNINPLGTWWFGELTMLFILMSIIVGLVNRYDEKTILGTFFSGSKDLFGVAMIIAVSAGVGEILIESGLQYTILEALVNGLSGVEGWVLILMIFFVTIPLTFLIPSTSGLAGTIFPILGATVYLQNSDPAFGALAATGFMFGTGIIGSILPTSSVVMGLLEIAGVGYERWIKPGAIMVVIGFVVSVLMIVTFGIIVG